MNTKIIGFNNYYFYTIFTFSAPSAAPGDLKVEQKLNKDSCTRNVHFSWSPPDSNLHHNGRIIGYVLKVLDQHSGLSQPPLETTCTSLDIPDLKFTSYTFTVCAKTSAGCGPTSEITVECKNSISKNYLFPTS